MDILSFILGVVALYLTTYLVVFVMLAFVFIVVTYLIYRAVRHD